MFNYFLNRRIINRISDRIFSEINGFFIGPDYPPVDQGHSEFEGNLLTAHEWDLHQDVSDIMINDLKISLGHFFPSFLKNKLIKLKNEILLYFYVDELDEDPFIISSDKVQSDLNYQSKIIFIKDHLEEKISKGIISVYEWLKGTLRKIERWLGVRSEIRSYYLLGDFMPSSYYPQAKPSQNRTFPPPKVKLNSGNLFHKRN